MGRKPKAEANEDAGTTPKPRRIGIELSDSITEEVAAFCAGRAWVKEGQVKDMLREVAREAAEAAVAGKVAEILAEKLK